MGFALRYCRNRIQVSVSIFRSKFLLHRKCFINLVSKQISSRIANFCKIIKYLVPNSLVYFNYLLRRNKYILLHYKFKFQLSKITPLNQLTSAQTVAFVYLFRVALQSNSAYRFGVITVSGNLRTRMPDSICGVGAAQIQVC